MLRRCVLTVFTLMRIRRAICWLVAPVTSRASNSSSRSLSSVGATSTIRYSSTGSGRFYHRQQHTSTIAERLCASARVILTDTLGREEIYLARSRGERREIRISHAPMGQTREREGEGTQG